MKVGKDTVKSIIKTYGKASDAQISGDEMKLNYSGKDYGESVYLTLRNNMMVHLSCHMLQVDSLKIR